ncbi:hypothetical protein [Solitalea koreensis]|uniref:Uncharacterized protein n=1 Tax=Solitalea koreensis TaxID=543615 RepID=A0A521B9L4_9SPHI|nr:hypothetical protein [Solitalea koreensis]SMO43735.1 hypothetical protein SAMN06265350_10217 [Solitalea koreensis]
MELENLKNAWKDLQGLQTNEQKSDLEIAEMLNNHSNDVINKIMKNIRMEMIVYAICMVLFYLPMYRLLNNLGGKIFMAVFYVMCIFFLLYYRNMMQYLKSFKQDASVRKNLTALVLKLEKFINVYYLSNLLLTPIVFVTVVFILIPKYVAEDINQYINDNPWAMIGMILIVLAMVGSTYWFIKSYSQKIYGQHLQKLKASLEELEMID